MTTGRINQVCAAPPSSTMRLSPQPLRVVFNKVWLLSTHAKWTTVYTDVTCALSELAPWHPQARHIDEQRYTKVPQTVGIRGPGNPRYSNSNRRPHMSNMDANSHWVSIPTKAHACMAIWDKQMLMRLIPDTTLTQCVRVIGGLASES